MMWPAIGVAGGIGALVAIHLHAMLDVRSPVIPRTTWRLPPDARRSIVLSFDDGPHPEGTPAILDLLAEFNACAIFFMIGSHVVRWPDTARQVVAAGHQIGNHGYSHRYSGIMRGTRFWLNEINRTNDAIQNACGVRPLWFRPPIGHRSFRQWRAIRRSGLRTLGWSCKSRDGVNTDDQAMYREVMARLHGQDIVLLHDGVDPHQDRDWRVTVALVRRLLPAIIDQKLTIVPMPTPNCLPSIASGNTIR